MKDVVAQKVKDVVAELNSNQSNQHSSDHSKASNQSSDLEYLKDSEYSSPYKNKSSPYFNNGTKKLQSRDDEPRSSYDHSKPNLKADEEPALKKDSHDVDGIIPFGGIQKKQRIQFKRNDFN